MEPSSNEQQTVPPSNTGLPPPSSQTVATGLPPPAPASQNTAAASLPPPQHPNRILHSMSNISSNNPQTTFQQQPPAYSGPQGSHPSYYPQRPHGLHQPFQYGQPPMVMNYGPGNMNSQMPMASFGGAPFQRSQNMIQLQNQNVLLEAQNQLYKYQEKKLASIAGMCAPPSLQEKQYYEPFLTDPQGLARQIMNERRFNTRSNAQSVPSDHLNIPPIEQKSVPVDNLQSKTPVPTSGSLPPPQSNPPGNLNNRSQFDHQNRAPSLSVTAPDPPMQLRPPLSQINAPTALTAHLHHSTHLQTPLAQTKRRETSHLLTRPSSIRTSPKHDVDRARSISGTGFSASLTPGSVIQTHQVGKSQNNVSLNVPSSTKSKSHRSKTKRKQVVKDLTSDDDSETSSTADDAAKSNKSDTEYAPSHHSSQPELDQDGDENMMDAQLSKEEGGEEEEEEEGEEEEDFDERMMRKFRAFMKKENAKKKKKKPKKSKEKVKTRKRSLAAKVFDYHPSEDEDGSSSSPHLVGHYKTKGRRSRGENKRAKARRRRTSKKAKAKIHRSKNPLVIPVLTDKVPRKTLATLQIVKKRNPKEEASSGEEESPRLDAFAVNEAMIITLKTVINKYLTHFSRRDRFQQFGEENTPGYPWFLGEVMDKTYQSNMVITLFKEDESMVKSMYKRCVERWQRNYGAFDEIFENIRFCLLFGSFSLLLAYKLFENPSSIACLKGQKLKLREVSMYFWDSLFSFFAQLKLSREIMNGHALDDNGMEIMIRENTTVFMDHLLEFNAQRKKGLKTQVKDKNANEITCIFDILVHSIFDPYRNYGKMDMLKKTIDSMWILSNQNQKWTPRFQSDVSQPRKSVDIPHLVEQINELPRMEYTFPTLFSGPKLIGELEYLNFITISFITTQEMCVELGEVLKTNTRKIEGGNDEPALMEWSLSNPNCLRDFMCLLARLGIGWSEHNRIVGLHTWCKQWTMGMTVNSGPSGSRNQCTLSWSINSNAYAANICSLTELTDNLFDRDQFEQGNKCKWEEWLKDMCNEQGVVDLDNPKIFAKFAQKERMFDLTSMQRVKKSSSFDKKSKDDLQRILSAQKSLHKVTKKHNRSRKRIAHETAETDSCPELPEPSKNATLDSQIHIEACPTEISGLGKGTDLLWQRDYYESYDLSDEKESINALIEHYSWGLSKMLTNHMHPSSYFGMQNSASSRNLIKSWMDKFFAHRFQAEVLYDKAKPKSKQRKKPPTPRWVISKSFRAMTQLNTLPWFGLHEVCSSTGGFVIRGGYGKQYHPSKAQTKAMIESMRKYGFISLSHDGKHTNARGKVEESAYSPKCSNPMKPDASYIRYNPLQTNDDHYLHFDDHRLRFDDHRFEK